ncbi:hypothetical protein HOD71_01305 [Candidatus Peribacteria bacterium]|jgi:hypothetical protein|nr:hypothetical protein [Candidatus Peribacteria bacterium]
MSNAEILPTDTNNDSNASNSTGTSTTRRNFLISAATLLGAGLVYSKLPDKDDKNDSVIDLNAQRLAAAKEAAAKRAKIDFKGQLHPADKDAKNQKRDPKTYGKGYLWLSSSKAVTIGDGISISIDDLHPCPDGNGKCSYSGMISIQIDGQPSKATVDVMCLGTDESTFNVREGANGIMSTISDITDDSNADAKELTQSHFQKCIADCWANRETSTDPSSIPAVSDEAVRGLGKSIISAMCEAWKNKTEDDLPKASAIVSQVDQTESTR